jgi:3-hydroxybutyryl-CoA dehydrogenase
LRRFENIGVVGAGMMGSEIALMFALAGHPTKLSDQERGLADKALDRLLGLGNAALGAAFGMPRRPNLHDAI